MIDMAANYIPNGNLEDNDGTEATYWTRSSILEMELAYYCKILS